MDKKELLKAIRKCNKVYATTHLTEHDTFNIQVIKADLVWNIKQCDEGYCNAFIARLYDNNDLYIG